MPNSSVPTTAFQAGCHKWPAQARVPGHGDGALGHGASDSHQTRSGGRPGLPGPAGRACTCQFFFACGAWEPNDCEEGIQRRLAGY